MFWGFADDDTWLDGFPVARTDYPLPFDMGLRSVSSMQSNKSDNSSSAWEAG